MNWRMPASEETVPPGAGRRTSSRRAGAFRSGSPGLTRQGDRRRAEGLALSRQQAAREADAARAAARVADLEAGVCRDCGTKPRGQRRPLTRGGRNWRRRGKRLAADRAALTAAETRTGLGPGKARRCPAGHSRHAQAAPAARRRPRWWPCPRACVHWEKWKPRRKGISPESKPSLRQKNTEPYWASLPSSPTRSKPRQATKPPWKPRWPRPCRTSLPIPKTPPKPRLLTCMSIAPDGRRFCRWIECVRAGTRLDLRQAMGLQRRARSRAGYCFLRCKISGLRWTFCWAACLFARHSTTLCGRPMPRGAGTAL